MDIDANVSKMATAIGEPARARILYSLMDNRARTSTELAVVAGVTPSTASVHLARLKDERLVTMAAQGKHRYYTLAGRDVARVLEGLSVLAAAPRDTFTPNTPRGLRAARTCYDHIAGTLGVALHDRMIAAGWLISSPNASYETTPKGRAAFEALGIELAPARRRFAFPCLDWSERRPHLGGALGAAFLKLALTRRWVTQDLDSRALHVTSLGEREMLPR